MAPLRKVASGVDGVFEQFARTLNSIGNLFKEFQKSLYKENVTFSHFKDNIEHADRTARSDASKMSIEDILVEFVENKISEPRVVAYVKNFSAKKDDDGYLRLERLSKPNEAEETYIRQLFYKYRMDTMLKESTVKMVTYLGLQYSKLTDGLKSTIKGFYESVSEINPGWDKTESTLRHLVRGLLVILTYFVNIYESLYIQLTRLTPQMRLLPELYEHATPELKKISKMNPEQQRLEYYKFLINSTDPFHVTDLINTVFSKAKELKSISDDKNAVMLYKQNLERTIKATDTGNFMNSEKLKWIQGGDNAILSFSIG